MRRLEPLSTPATDTATAGPIVVKPAPAAGVRTDGAWSRVPWWFVVTVTALALCAVALVFARDTDLAPMTDLGLASVLPPIYFVALASLTLAFTLTLRRDELPLAPLVIQLIVLVVMLYGIAPLMEDTTRTATPWKLRGITESILRTGEADPKIDAFFNWPGFFILMGLFTRLAGISDQASSFPAWSPIFFNLLNLAPLLMLLRTVTKNPRVPWLGVWFFCHANWIGQDYLSPQALNYFLFLVILAALVTWFSKTRGEEGRSTIPGWLPSRLRRRFGDEKFPATTTPVQRLGLIAIVIVIFAAIAPSHQLTPIMAIGVVTLLVVFNRITPRGLPVLMLVITLVWIVYMAVAYLTGHFAQVAAPVGAVGENVEANLTGRFRGSPGHQAIASIRTGTSAFIWIFALVGGLRAARRGRASLTFALLAVGPFLMLPMQAYGGELLLRAYLFSLPAMACFAAQAFLPEAHSRMSRGVIAGVTLMSITLAGGFTLARYGDERKDYFNAAEVAGVKHLYASAPPNARFVALNTNLPWRYQEYETRPYIAADARTLVEGPNALRDLLTSRGRPTYLIVTRSQLAYEQIVDGQPAGTWPQRERDLLTSGIATKVFENSSTWILRGTPARKLLPPRAELGNVAPPGRRAPSRK